MDSEQPLSDEQRAFETWAILEGKTVALQRRPSGGYRYALAQNMWEAWQARAALTEGRRFSAEATPCDQVNDGFVCGAARRGGERLCPDCNGLAAVTGLTA